jgi:flagellin-like protein
MKNLILYRACQKSIKRYIPKKTCNIMKFREDDAVSPVIGVILMVAVTVVLAVAVFYIAGQYTQNPTQSLTAITLSIKDSPVQLNERTPDPVVVVTLQAIQGTPLDLNDVYFTVSNDRVGWSTVSQSPSAGVWQVGSSLTLTETGPAQVSAGPLYIRVYSRAANAQIFESGVVYVN